MEFFFSHMSLILFVPFSSFCRGPQQCLVLARSHILPGEGWGTGELET